MSARRYVGPAVVVAGVAIMGTFVLAQSGNDRPANRAEHRYSPAARNDVLQPTTMPPLPSGMTMAMIEAGDRIFHGGGGCYVCHGVEAEGMPAAGDGITVGLAYIPAAWPAIDSLVTAGLSDAMTRSPIAMPGRGARGNLSQEQVRQVAAYVWAISQVRGEPWPNGHESHEDLVVPAAVGGTANDLAVKLKRPIDR